MPPTLFFPSLETLLPGISKVLLEWFKLRSRGPSRAEDRILDVIGRERSKAVLKEADLASAPVTYLSSIVR